MDIDNLNGKDIAKYLVEDYMNLPTLMLSGEGYLITYQDVKTREVLQFEYKEEDFERCLKDFKIVKEDYYHKLHN